MSFHNVFITLKLPGVMNDITPGNFNVFNVHNVFITPGNFAFI